MEKKTINLKEASFTQAINISAQWCKEWGEDLLSEEAVSYTHLTLPTNREV